MTVALGRSVGADAEREAGTGRLTGALELDKVHLGTRTTQKLPSAGSGPHPRTSAVSSSPPSDRPCPSRPQR